MLEIERAAATIQTADKRIRKVKFCALEPDFAYLRTVQAIPAANEQHVEPDVPSPPMPDALPEPSTLDASPAPMPPELPKPELPKPEVTDEEVQAYLEMGESLRKQLDAQILRAPIKGIGALMRARSELETKIVQAKEHAASTPSPSTSTDAGSTTGGEAMAEPTKPKRQRRLYDDATREKMIGLMRSGISIATLSKEHGIPYQTMGYWGVAAGLQLQKKYTERRRMKAASFAATKAPEAPKKATKQKAKGKGKGKTPKPVTPQGPSKLWQVTMRAPGLAKRDPMTDVPVLSPPSSLDARNQKLRKLIHVLLDRAASGGDLAAQNDQLQRVVDALLDL